MGIEAVILDAFNYPTSFRRATGSYLNGEFVRGTPTVFPLVLSGVQPLTDAEMLSLPEGRRERQHKKAYTNILLHGSEQLTQDQADQILFQGNWFEVFRVETWVWGGMGDMNHWKVIIARLNP